MQNPYSNDHITKVLEAEAKPCIVIIQNLHSASWEVQQSHSSKRKVFQNNNGVKQALTDQSRLVTLEPFVTSFNFIILLAKETSVLVIGVGISTRQRVEKEIKDVYATDAFFRVED